MEKAVTLNTKRQNYLVILCEVLWSNSCFCLLIKSDVGLHLDWLGHTIDYSTNCMFIAEERIARLELSLKSAIFQLSRDN
jgi:hypothetical protein